MIAKLKRQIKYFFLKNNQNSFIYKILIKINKLCFHQNVGIKKIEFGNKNRNLIFYVIEKNNDEEGLVSLILNTLNKVEFAKTKGYIPYIYYGDKIQYKHNHLINGSMNPWEYYFKEPCNYSLNEIKDSQNVIWDNSETIDSNFMFSDNFNFHDSETIKKESKFLNENLLLQDSLYKHICQEAKFLNNNKVLGVFIRGTDYTSLKPAGHPVQPSVIQIVDRINLFLDQNHVDFIYLVTEDIKIEEQLKKQLVIPVLTTGNNVFNNYKKGTFIANDIKNRDDSYKIGLDYLTRIYILSKCSFLISSKTNGSKLALLLNNGKYKYTYFFELGFY